MEGQLGYVGISKMVRHSTWESARCGDRIPGNRQDVETEYLGISKTWRQSTRELARWRDRIPRNQQDVNTEHLISKMEKQST